MTPPLSTGLFPGILISGSSPAAARRAGRGSQLVGAHVTRGETLGFRWFWLDVRAGNLPAIRLDRAAGFRVRSTTAGAGRDLTGLRMGLELDDA